jgi:transposase
MLSETVDVVIGCDTHRDEHSLAVLAAPSAVVVSEFEIAASGAGYRACLEGVASQFPGPRAWAIEGTGSYGKGLCRYLDRPRGDGRRDHQVASPFAALTSEIRLP